MALDIMFPGEAANASASEAVRRWDSALVLGPLAAGVAAGLLTWGLWKIGTPALDAREAFTYAACLPKYALHGNPMDQHCWRELQYELAVSLRVALTIAGTLAAGIGAALYAARPISRVRHIEGPRLRDGRDALRAARTASHPQGWIRLHPDLNLPKEVWTRAVLIVGSVGSGKTQILWPIVKQLVEMGAHGRKVFIWDIKGDYVKALPQAVIINPWDGRSAAWDIAADIRTPAQASILAQSLCPPGKEGDFFADSAQSILRGILHALMVQAQHEEKPWGWREFADALLLPGHELLALLRRYYPEAAQLIVNPTDKTAESILSTVAAGTQVVHLLAQAWGVRGIKRFSFTRWAKDDWTGRRQVILSKGDDPDMTRRYLNAIVNLVVAEVISPKLQDNEKGRTLAFVLDEFSSLGKIPNILQFIEAGRSKGCCVILGYQAQEQIAQVYGRDFSDILQGIVGTQIVCQTQMGDTQKRVAARFDKRRVAFTSMSHSPSHVGASSAQHEELRDVVQPWQLSRDLGKRQRKGKTYMRSIVALGGQDPMILDFPVSPIPNLRPGFVPAPWTGGVLKRDIPKPPDAGEVITGMVARELDKALEPAPEPIVEARKESAMDRLMREEEERRARQSQ